MYHHAYKSAREDQIGFQKYKIHTAILKNKRNARPSGVPERGYREEQKDKRKKGGKKSGEMSAREEERDSRSTKKKHALIGERDSAR